MIGDDYSIAWAIKGQDAEFKLRTGVALARGLAGCVYFQAGAFTGEYNVVVRPRVLEQFHSDIAEMTAGQARSASLLAEDARFEVELEKEDGRLCYVQVELRPPDGPELQIIYRFRVGVDELRS